MKGNRLRRQPLLLLAAAFCAFFWLAAAGRGQEDSQWDPRTGRYISKNNNDVRIERRGKKRRAARRASSGPATISVLIVSSQPHSNVSINKQPQEQPTDEEGYLEVPLRPGTYEIGVSKNGYTSIAREVEVSALGAYQQDVEFTQVPAVYKMRVMTEPAEADVHLDDVYKGRSNGEGVLFIEGVAVNTPHTLRAVKDGWLPSSVALKPDEQPPPFKLLRDAVRLKVKTKPAEMEVYLDDAYKGTSSAEGVLFVERVPVNTPYTLRGVKKGFETKQQPLTPSSEETFIELSAARANTDLEELKQLAAGGSLAKSLAVYGEVAQQNPDNPALPAIFESILQRLNARSSDALTPMGPYGLPVKAVDAKELSDLFRGALKWRGGDAALEVRAEYWATKYWEGVARESTSEDERANALVNTQAAAQRLASLNPRDPYMLFDLGVIYMRLGDNDEARKYIEDAGSLNQNWAVPLFATAQLDLAAGDKQSNKSVKSRLYQRAILNLTRVISLKPDTPRVRELLSLAYSAAERHQEAIEGGREAVAANPNSAYAHYVLGQAYYQLGAQKDKNEYRNAIAEFNVALTLPAEPLDPQTNSSVKEKIALMKKALGIKR